MHIFISSLITFNGDILKKTKKFFINGTILTVAALVMRSISMLFNIYISNKIGSEAIGIFSLLMSVYIFAITISTSGLNIASTYIVSREFSKGNYSNGFRVIKTCILFAIALSILGILTIFIFSKPITYYCFNNKISEIPIYLIGIGLPFISISCVLNGYFSAIRKAYKSALTQFFELLVKIIFTCVFLMFFDLKNVESVCILLILADVISELFSFSLLYVLYRIDKKKYNFRDSNTFSYKREILKTYIPVSITSCIRSRIIHH